MCRRYQHECPSQLYKSTDRCCEYSMVLEKSTHKAAGQDRRFPYLVGNPDKQDAIADVGAIQCMCMALKQFPKKKDTVLTLCSQVCYTHYVSFSPSLPIFLFLLSLPLPLPPSLPLFLCPPPSLPFLLSLSLSLALSLSHSLPPFLPPRLSHTHTHTNKHILIHEPNIFSNVNTNTRTKYILKRQLSHYQ